MINRMKIIKKFFFLITFLSLFFLKTDVKAAPTCTGTCYFGLQDCAAYNLQPGSGSCDPGAICCASDTTAVFGRIIPPASIARYSSNPGQGIGSIIQLVVWALIIGAGVYALINFILAGYAFLSAGDDPKKVAGAWAKIWQTALGLLVAAGSIILAAIFGKLIFGDFNAILNPTLPTL